MWVNIKDLKNEITLKYNWMFKAKIIIYCGIYNIYGSKMYDNDNIKPEREETEINFCKVLIL